MPRRQSLSDITEAILDTIDDLTLRLSDAEQMTVLANVHDTICERLHDIQHEVEIERAIAVAKAANYRPH